jgi:UPF0755 protein
LKGLRFLVVLALSLAVAGGAVIFMLYRQVAAFRATSYGSDLEKVVEIPMGSSPRAVVRRLTRAGVLSDETLAWWTVRYLKRDHRIMRAGEYVFAGRLRPDEVLEKVYRGEFKTYRFTVPEGVRMDEIAAIVQKSGLARAADLLVAMRDAKVAAELGVPFANVEGFLFPDTYTFTKGPTPSAIVAAMVARFKEEYRKADANRSPGVALTEGETAILASIIEKETGAPDERPHISCVFHNRLRRGIRLQTDPTVMYATMLRNGGQWSNNITKADLLTPHPYNTYTRAGLPPGPIASPGAAALSAALHPSQCADLYFVSRNDGSHVFCPDLSCHAAAVKKWQIDFSRMRRPEPSAVPAPKPHKARPLAKKKRR